MIFLIIQYTLISLLLISIFHYLYDFFKNNLTVPKVKDLVNKPASAYSEIYETIHKDISNSVKNLNDTQHTNINLYKNNSNTYQNDENLNMKDELKKYLSKLNSNDTNNLELNGMNIQDWSNYQSTL
jgi:cell shape-determining protein MreC